MTGAGETLVGIDIGGSGIRVQFAMGEQREAVRHLPFDDSTGAEAALRMLADCCGDARPKAAGISAAATLDGGGIITRWPSRPDWVAVPLVPRIRAMLQCPVLAQDDGTLGALAEARARDAHSLVYMGLGTGVGGGIVTGGQVLDGEHGGAGEFGHLQIPGVAAQCVCGRTGCLQSVAAWPAFCARVAVIAGRTLSPGQIGSAVNEGLPAAQQALVECAEAVAWALVNVQEILDPAVLVIGGGFQAQCASLVGLIDAAARRMRRAGTAGVPVESARYGALSSLEGALILARSQLGHDAT